MAGKIFINYRRDDVPGDARGVRDGLAQRFGKANLFMDVDNLLAGQRFDIELAKALEACDVLIAVIGPRWIDLLRARQAGGERDYAREEIAAALKRGIVVIPVRVGREGNMPPLPRKDDLPADIGDLVLHQKADVAHERFGRDIGELIQGIVAIRNARRPVAVGGARRGRAVQLAGAVVALVAAYSGAHFAGAPVPWPVAATPKPGETFRDCERGCPEMVVVPAGDFMMGSNDDDGEQPPHKVTIKQAFAVGKYDVTFDEWDACVAARGCKTKAEDNGWSRGRQPVINVSWDDAKEYAAWLSGKTGQTYRLLSEAEWEYAARAGTTTEYPWGDAIGKGNANCNDCGSEWDFKQTAPVGSFRPNAFGLHDMHGNVWQWVEDNFHTNYTGNPPADGSVWQGGDANFRVLRGGSWGYLPVDLRSAGRDRDRPVNRNYSRGFRLARTLLHP